MIKRKLKYFFTGAAAYYQLILNKKSYLHSAGWLRSLKNSQPSDSEGAPIPWMNFSMVQLLRERLNKQQEVFEYGSGFSTQFYAQRVNAIESVEYDAAWFDQIKQNLPDNADLIFVDADSDGQYCRSIQQSGKTYDVVIVDGRDRVNCVIQAMQSVTAQGVIILDDSHRPKYQKAIEIARENGYKDLGIEGLKPTGWRLDRTTILYRPDNCFGL